MQRIILSWLQADRFFKVLALFTTFIVIYLSLKQPGQEFNPWTFLFFRQDIVLHFSCYFSLTIIYFTALFKYKSAIKTSFLLSFFIGCLMELLQLIQFFKRTFDVADIAANFIGSLCGIILIQRLFADSLKE
jgi:VanZ family protein